MEVHFTEVAGSLTRYYRAGSGPVVLLVHGIGMTADIWLRNIDVLAETHTVIAPDLLGCGFTSGMTSAGRSPIPEMLDHLTALLDELQVDECTVVGSSLGGWLAALLHFRAPQRFSRLVFVCCEVTLMGSTEQIRATAQGSLRNGRSAFDNPTLEGTWQRIRRLVVDPAAVPEGVALAQFIASGQPDAREAFERRVGGLQLVQESDDLSVRDKLASIDVPVMCIWGESDIRGDAVLRDEVARTLRARATTLANTGHLAQLEQPERFNALLCDFLRSLPQPSLADAAR